MTRRVDWFRVAAEGLVIVTSILLAFGIDAWWDARQARVEEREILRALETDFAANATHAKDVVDLHMRNEDLLTRLDSASATDIAAMPRDSVGQFLQAMWDVPTFDPRIGALDGVITSGRLGIIRDSDLRDRLVEWRRRIDDAAEEKVELRAAGGRVLDRVAALGGPWGGDTPGSSPVFTSPPSAEIMRRFPSGDLGLAAGDPELAALVRAKRLRAVLYVRVLLTIAADAEAVRGLVLSLGEYK